jgi:hypothetical protein
MLRITSIVLACLFLMSPAEARHRHGHHHARHHVHHRGVVSTGTIVAHPEGCPHVAFCACGAAVHILGSARAASWLAAAWYRYPRVSPAPQTAGVLPHHVIALEYQVSGSIWMVYDPNSGGHATRIHAVDISRYTIVDPRGVASNERRIRTARHYGRSRQDVRGYGRANSFEQGRQVRGSNPRYPAWGRGAVRINHVPAGRTRHFLEHYSNTGQDRARSG